MITLEIVQMLYIRFCAIWGDKFTAKHTQGFIEIWYEEWLDGLQGLDPACFRDAIKYCKYHLEWSPSIAEFIRICERSLNIPNARECMKFAINRDFSHPMVKSIYEKITTYEMRNSSEIDLLKRFEELHFEQMVDFRRKRYLSANPIKKVEEESHGREIQNNHGRGNSVQKVKSYLF